MIETCWSSYVSKYNQCLLLKCIPDIFVPSSRQDIKHVVIHECVTKELGEAFWLEVIIVQNLLQ